MNDRNDLPNALRPLFHHYLSKIKVQNVLLEENCPNNKKKLKKVTIMVDGCKINTKKNKMSIKSFNQFEKFIRKVKIFKKNLYYVILSHAIVQKANHTEFI